MGRSTLSTAPLLDARGLLRFTTEFTRHLQDTQAPFVCVFIDTSGQRVAMAFSAQPQPGSFRLLQPGGRPALYLKGALQAAGASTAPGVLYWQQEGQLCIVGRDASLRPGPWQPFHCRSSADIPMATLDRRGTLTLDRLCVRSLPADLPASAEPRYDAASGFFTLTFCPEGSLAVRRVSSHAELSFRGTLSSLGLSLPGQRLRYTASVQGLRLRFCFKDPFLPSGKPPTY